jgi:purine-cytosine permease-like protein
VLPLEGKYASMRQVLSHKTAFRSASVVTAINVLVATGFSIAGVIVSASIRPAADAPTDASLVFALYAAARALPLAGFVLVAIYKRASLSLLVLGGLAGIAQFLDAGIGVIQHDPGKTGGPLVIAVPQMLALWGLFRSMPKQPAPSPGA